MKRTEAGENFPFLARLWRAVVCPTFTYWLLITWVALALLSQLVPQDGGGGLSPEKVVPPEFLFFLRRAGLTDVLHSSWFICGWLLLFLNLALILADRWKAAWLQLLKRLPANPHAETSLQMAIPTSRGLNPRDRADFQLLVERWALPAFGKVHVIQDEGELGDLRLAVEKGGPSLLGLCLAILGTLILMVGGAMDVLYGLKGELLLEEGRSISRFRVTEFSSTGWPLWIRQLGGPVENFEYFYLDYQLRFALGQAASGGRSLVFLREGKVLFTQALREGQEVGFESTRFEPVGGTPPSGKDLHLVLEVLDRKSGKTWKMEPLSEGKAQALDGGTLKWVSFSEEGVLGPAAELEYQEAGSLQQKIQLFEQHPQYDSVRRKKDRYVFSMEALRPLEQVTLKAAWQPGSAWYWGGLLFLGLGSVLWAFFTPRTYWIDLTAQGVLFGVTSSRPKRVKKEFEELAMQLRLELGSLDPVESE